MSFLDLEALCRSTPGFMRAWVDIGGHESIGWPARKAAELDHLITCGPRCPPGCGPASELLGIAGVHGRFRGDLIVPPVDTVFSLTETLAIVRAGVGSSCTAIVIDDLGALLKQQPTASWWRDFADGADASTSDGVKVLLLASPEDLTRWPSGLPQPAWVRRGNGWWLGSQFGSDCGSVS